MRRPWFALRHEAESGETIQRLRGDERRYAGPLRRTAQAFVACISLTGLVAAGAPLARAQVDYPEEVDAAEARAGEARETREGEAPGEDSDERHSPQADDGQTTVSAHQGIEEIRVTAQKRETSAQQTPVAISVFDQAMLDRAGVDDLENLAFQVPNFHYGEFFGAASITIRGVATQGGDQATAFHLDGVYQNSALVPSTLSFFDLERIEVLRGPQGTLYGRNATGGSINVISKRPTYDYEAFGDVQLGNYNQLIMRGVVNVPIVDELLAIRVSGVGERRDGYMENLVETGPQDDRDDAGSWAIRGQVRVNPADDIEWLTRVLYSRADNNGFGTRLDGDLPSSVPLSAALDPQDIYRNATPNPSDPRQIYLDTAGFTHADFIGVNSALEWDLFDLGFLGDTRFTFLASWQNRTQHTLADIDLSDGEAYFAEGGSAAPPASSGPSLIDVDVRLDDTEVVLETNLASNDAGSAWQWLVGGFFLWTDMDIVIDPLAIFPFDFCTLPEGDPDQGSLCANPGPVNIQAIGVTDPFTVSTRNDISAAAFGDLTWSFADDWKLNLGLRYSHDWKKGAIDSEQVDFVFPAINFVLPCAIPGVEQEESASWGAVTGRAKLQWQFQEDKMAYASFSTGYKAGTIEFSVPVTGDLTGCEVEPVPNTDPERIYAFEIGSKNQFFDSRLQANLTGFAYVYKDIQVTTLVQTSFVTENADRARLLGAELELLSIPVDELLLTANLAYLNGMYTSYENGCLVEVPETCGTLDFTGNRMPRAPRFSTTLAAQYEFGLGRFGSLTPRMQYFFSSMLYFRASNYDRDRQDAYSKLDFRLTWRSDDERLGIELFVDNALDEDVVSTKFVSSPLIGSPTISSYNAPRTFGGRLSVTF